MDTDKNANHYLLGNHHQSRRAKQPGELFVVNQIYSPLLLLDHGNNNRPPTRMEQWQDNEFH